MTIAERLVQARGNIPRDIVANAVGISLSAISMYENGQRVPRDEIKVKLADYYHTTVQALFFDTDSDKEARRDAMNNLKEIEEKLAAIESLLQRLPEIQAAVFLLMRDEYETAKAQGRDARQLWSVPNPDQR